jgi:DNA-binding CsgD family transcriptional regulator
VGNPTPPRITKYVSAVPADESVPKEGESALKTAAGFLLMDSSLRPFSFNAEAVEILSYPDKLANLTHADALLAAKIRSNLVSRQAPAESPFVTEFRSGRRRYFCRAFSVGSCVKDLSRPSIAVLLERGPSGLVPLSLASRQFNLTQREREVLEYLLQGLTSKEIANRMDISPNTVKAFLRMVMVKTRVSSRSAMVVKLILAQPR